MLLQVTSHEFVSLMSLLLFLTLSDIKSEDYKDVCLGEKYG